MMTSASIQSTYLRLRPDSSIEQLPVDDRFWPRLMAGELGNFHHEYLVTSYTFSRETWHTAKIRTESVMLFITAGEGTRNRPA
jgi:hypothetical protein